MDLKDLYRPLYRRLAGNISAFNPALASQLAGAYLEMGGEQSLTVKPEPAPWRNEYAQGLGYFFRGTDSRGESLMVLRCGNSWGHHHNDDGSLHFFCAGRSWVVDSAFSYPQENGVRKFRADGHSRWTLRDIYPLNHLWQFNRGWITHHESDCAFPHAVAFTPVYMAETNVQLYAPLRQPMLHWRCVVQLSPSAYLILDRSDIDMPQLIRFHVPLDAPFVLEDAPSPFIASGHYLRIRSLAGLCRRSCRAWTVPVQAPGTFTTREIQYAMNPQPVAALLVMVENAGSPSMLAVTHAGERIAIRHPEFAAELNISAPEAIELLDLKTQSRVVIPMKKQSA